MHDAHFRAAKTPSGCLEGTRVKLLGDIMEWLESPESKRVLWTSGPGGTGKSAIAKTACVLFATRLVLLASFFISRNEEARRRPEAVLHTIVYYCARQLPKFARHVYNTLKNFPETLSLSLADQVIQLLAEPLNEENYDGPDLVIAIDAFDECELRNEREGGQLLPALLNAIDKSPFPVRLFITSRGDVLREYQDHRVVRLQDIESQIVEGDICLYLHDEFRRIALARGVSECWPSEKDIKTIAKRASLLFVYAVTVVRYIEHRTLDPTARLRMILDSNNAGGLVQYTLVDDLYTQVLVDALPGQDGDGAIEEELLRSIVGTLVLLRDPLTIEGVAKLLGQSVPIVRAIIGRLSPILHFNETEPIRLFHPSFTDFIVDPSRCRDPRFRINVADHHGFLAARCLFVMNSKLKKDICRIGDPSLLNSEAPDMERRIKENVSEALRYACSHWPSHLAATATTTSATHAALHKFCENHLFHWIEVLSILGDVSAASSLRLSAVVDWCKVCPSLPGSHSFVV